MEVSMEKRKPKRKKVHKESVVIEIDIRNITAKESARVCEESKRKEEESEDEAKDISALQYLFNESKKIANKDFAKFSAVIAVLFSAGLWVIKSMWYAHYSGAFSVYKIDRCYINMDNEDVFLQIIQWCAILVLGIFVNYVYYWISTTEDKSWFHWKRKLKKSVFWLLEMIILFVYFMQESDTNWNVLLEENIWSDLLAAIIVLWFVCLFINIYAIEIALSWKWKKKKGNNDEILKDIVKKKQIKWLLVLVVVTIAVELVVVYETAKSQERNRHDYKVIVTSAEEGSDSRFNISCGDNGNAYRVYPIVFENQDCYIVTRLYTDNGKINIDYTYQRIVDKEGQETLYTDDVYQICIGSE